MRKFKIGYFADGPWGVNAFNLINADPDIEIVFIVFRFKNGNDKELRGLAIKNRIDYFYKENINSEDFLSHIKLYECDLFVSMSFDQIFKKDILKIPPLGIINCHAGALPYYRGRNILNWALRNNENFFGITVHYVDEGIDTGNIILQRHYPITDDDDYSTLLKKAELECGTILYDAIKKIQNNTVFNWPQDVIDEFGFYCTKLQPGDEFINWGENSRDIFNIIRSACKPGPMALTYINKQEVRINKSEYLKYAPKFKGIPGAIIGIEDDGFLVKTGDSYIKIIEAESNYPKKLRIGDRFIWRQNNG